MHFAQHSGKELVVNHNQEENLYLAIREAFDDMGRKLEETARIYQGHVKLHPEVRHGEIVRLFNEDQFGFIVTEGGDEYYFNSDNLVKHRFSYLRIGMPVHFIEKFDASGLRAVRVSVPRNHVSSHKKAFMFQ